jgi:hypothetical protein
MKLGSALWLVVSLAPGATAQTSAPVTAVIDINTSVTTPIAPNFSGINDSLHMPVEYWDYRFSALAATLGVAWVRFPALPSSMRLRSESLRTSQEHLAQ